MKNKGKQNLTDDDKQLTVLPGEMDPKNARTALALVADRTKGKINFDAMKIDLPAQK